MDANFSPPESSKYDQIQRKLESMVGRFSFLDGRVYIKNIPQNRAIFSMLHQHGFFEFHSTNLKKEIVGWPQVIAFYCRGGKNALSRGFSCRHRQHEVHHIDSNPLNNNWDNLVYLSVDDHYYVSSSSNTCFYTRPSSPTPQPTKWNSQGKPVRNHMAFLSTVVKHTCEATALFRSDEHFDIPLVNIFQCFPKFDFVRKIARKIPDFVTSKLWRALDYYDPSMTFHPILS